MSAFIQHYLILFRPALFALAVLCNASVAEPKFLDNADVGQNQRHESLVDSSQAGTAASVTPKLSPADAADLVRKKIGGQVLNVNTRQLESGVIYAVKVLNSGRMKIIHVDGQTGQFLNN